MLELLGNVLKIGGVLAADLPEIIQIVKDAIAAFEAKDQASLQAAHDQAVAKANSLAPS